MQLAESRSDLPGYHVHERWLRFDITRVVAGRSRRACDAYYRAHRADDFAGAIPRHVGNVGANASSNSPTLSYFGQDYRSELLSGERSGYCFLAIKKAH